jgi:hypothetical protein
MSHYSALIVERRGSPTVSGPAWETFAPTLRVPTVTSVRVTTEIPGGWQECDFTIPAEHVRWEADTIAPYTLVWVFSGAEHIFYGHIIEAIPDPDTGAIQVTCDGAYRRLEDTRMRVIWSDGDLTQLPTAPGSSKVGTAQVNSNGDLELSFARGTPSGSGNYLNQGDYIAVDYWLFDENTGTRDTKKVDGWHIAIGTASTFQSVAALEVRIYGMQNPNDSSPTLLQTFAGTNTGRNESSDGSSGANSGSPWPVAGGYRLIRVGLWANTGISGLANDRMAKITEFAVGTRVRALGVRTIDPGAAFPMTTTQIAADVWAQSGYDVSYLLTEEAAASTGQMVVGNITDPGIRADGMSFPQWTSPREVIDAVQAIDGYEAGMFGPTRNPPAGSTSTMSSHAINSWYRQPAELVYQPWNDLGSPNIHVRLARGAEWTPDGQQQELLSAAYVGYTQRSGHQLSVFYEDTSIENRMFEQGIHQAVDWQIDPPVSGATPSNLAQQFVADSRQPVLSGTITLRADRPGSVELPGGGRVQSLWSLRPGVVRIVDAKGARAGRVTALTVTAADGQNPTMAVLTVNDPAAQQLGLREARIARREARRRHR